MKRIEEFPLFKTKATGVDQSYDLADAQQRAEYFQAKAGEEITKLKKYFADGNTFVAYMLGKKNSGKGTYTKLLSEIFGKDKIEHISVGDIVRDVYNDLSTAEKKQELIDYLHKNYRGFISVDEAVDALLGKSQDKLLPNEFILALVKREIDKLPKKTLFLDGFPRNLDQVSYSLYFRDLINYRDDLDIFVNIDIPESVIDMRMRSRVICPECHSPRSLKLFATKEVGYDQETKEFYLKCDNSECMHPGTRMVGKEGDDKGIESIRQRLEIDDQLADKVFALHGIPKILLRNAVPVAQAKDLVDNYEITPEYYYEYDQSSDQVKTLEKPWIVKDDEGEEVYSLLAATVTLMLIKNLVKVLDL